MSAVHFEEWAVPDLELELGGRTYRVPPPSVDDAKVIFAAAVRAEINLGLVKAEVVPEGTLAVLDRLAPDDHPALGAVYDQLVAAGIPQATIDRMAYYAVFYWARGKVYADAIAEILWAPRSLAEPEVDARPKG